MHFRMSSATCQLFCCDVFNTSDIQGSRGDGGGHHGGAHGDVVHNGAHGDVVHGDVVHGDGAHGDGGHEVHRNQVLPQSRDGEHDGCDGLLRAQPFLGGAHSQPDDADGCLLNREPALGKLFFSTDAEN